MTRCCPYCGEAPSATWDSAPTPFEQWLFSHGRSGRCRQNLLAAELYGRGLAAFAARHEFPGVPFEAHHTSAPESAHAWGVVPPAPEEEVGGGRARRAHVQFWRPLWVRVVSDCYEVLLAGFESKPLASPAAARGYRDAAVDRLSRETEAAEAVASVFLMERQRLVDQWGSLVCVAVTAPLIRPWALLRELGMPGTLHPQRFARVP